MFYPSQRFAQSATHKLSLRTMFNAPTPTEVAVAIVQQQAQRIDEQALTEILGSIKNLSAEEIQSLVDTNRAMP